MNSYLTEDFINCFNKLPVIVQEQARRNYRLWKENQHYPSLRFKRIHPQEAIYSIRIGKGWRALGLVENDTITWFWIVSHADYDKLLSQL